MPLVEMDGLLAELAVLDVVDVTAEGRLRLNAAFVEACMASLDREPGRLGTIVQDQIVARAVERGYAGCLDAEAMALAALELGAAEAPDQDA